MKLSKLFIPFFFYINLLITFPLPIISNSLSIAAETLTKTKVIYDPSYYKISYPNGDIPKDRGVCTDVIIRAYRILNIDLQQLIHEDMKANFSDYPKNWVTKSIDKNIDHRRIPNLVTFFGKYGKSKIITKDEKDYQSGDIVVWNLGNGILHIGIVGNTNHVDTKRKMIVHNIGQGQVMEDILFKYKIIGHYRYP